MRGLRGSDRSGRPAFGRASKPDRPTLSRRQKLVGVGSVGVLVVTIAALAAVSAPSSASRPELFGGSLVLENTRGEPVVVDLASGALTTRFAELGAYVDREDPNPHITPVTNGTVLVSGRGSLNFLGVENYLVKKDAGLLLAPDLDAARALAAGSAAFVVARHPDGTYVALVDRSTLESNKTKGSATIPGAFSERPHTFATADGALWMVRDDNVLLELAPDADTETALVQDEHEELDPSAVLAAGGAPAEDGQPTRVVAATGDNLLLVDATGATPSVELDSGVANATRIVPSTGSGAVVWFLYENPEGWWTVGVDTDTRTRVGPTRIDGDFASAPVPPAFSEGRLYTLEGSDPRGGLAPLLLSIDPVSGTVAPLLDADGEPVAYAFREGIEQPSFVNALVIARGPRVVFNNPEATFAHVAFSDGTRPPALVDKTDDRKTKLDPTQSPSALVAPPPEDGSTPTTAAAAAEATPPAAAPPPPPTVDAELECASTDQKPHEPLIVGATPLPRAVTLAWSYETVDTRDCVPSSYLVKVRPLNGARGVANSERQVDGQHQITFDGLRPNSTYEFTVTARVAAEETESRPTQVTTLPSGPDRPGSVTAVADPVKGVWRVSWTSCRDDCDVPVAAWVVQGIELCGAGNTVALPALDAPGGATSLEIPYGDLVGRSVRFQVYGRAEDGINGDARPADRCVEGWRHPALERLNFTAEPTGAQPDGKIGARLALSITGATPIAAFGSADVQLVYAVDGTAVATRGLPGGDRDEVLVTATPGKPHTATLVITSHGKSWTLTSRDFEQNIPWAPLTLTAQSQPNAGNPNAATITATVNGAFVNAPASTVVASGTFVCGSRSAPPFADRPVSAQGGFSVEGVDLVELGGPCQLNAKFREPGPEPVHDGPSPAVNTSVNLGTPNGSTSVGTFSASVTAPDGPLTFEGNPSPTGGALTVSLVTKKPRKISCGPPVPVAAAPYVSSTIDIFSCIEEVKAERRGTFKFVVGVTVTRQYLGTQITTEFETPEIIIVGGIPEETTTTTTTAAPTTTTTTPSSSSLSTGSLVGTFAVALVAMAAGRKRRFRNPYDTIRTTEDHT